MSRKFMFRLLVLVTICCSLSTLVYADAANDKAYNPAIIYSGDYSPVIVYYQLRGKNGWVRGPNGTFPSAVLCLPARQALGRTGLWRGHLRPNGSCLDSKEPLDWATGNRLNYDGVK